VSPRSRASVELAGVALTHPDRQVYAELGTTKKELGEYYVRVAAHLLPWIERRPLSVVRCPEGRHGACFYQKHFAGPSLKGLKLVPIEEKTGVGTYAAITAAAGLVQLVQLGALELHAWTATIDRLECPDQLVIDLDPGDGVAWPRMRAAALEARERLRDLGLASFVRTTGGKGLHVVAPLVRRYSWEEVRGAAKGVADAMQADTPSEFVARADKSLRRGKIYVDYLRNARGATAIANYSTRAVENAPTATPIAWEELPHIRGSAHYRLTNIHRRLARLKAGSPWPDFHRLRQRLRRLPT
jgi:bifunctional non-homologous end joining protein LigD